MSNTYAEEIVALTNKWISALRTVDWPFDANLKSLKVLTEGTVQEYQGRTVLELIQNGHDALDHSTGRIEILVQCLADSPVLYVANDGHPFSADNFSALLNIGLSDKRVDEGIGDKGLGFRSVLQVTDRPEVYSQDPATHSIMDSEAIVLSSPRQTNGPK